MLPAGVRPSLSNSQQMPLMHPVSQHFIMINSFSRRSPQFRSPVHQICLTHSMATLLGTPVQRNTIEYNSPIIVFLFTESSWSSVVGDIVKREQIKLHIYYWVYGRWCCSGLHYIDCCGLCYVGQIHSLRCRHRLINSQTSSSEHECKATEGHPWEVVIPKYTHITYMEKLVLFTYIKVFAFYLQLRYMFCLLE